MAIAEIALAGYDQGWQLAKSRALDVQAEKEMNGRWACLVGIERGRPLRAQWVEHDA